MKYRIEEKLTLLTLEKGDYINQTFEIYAEKKKIGFSWLNGIGAIENPEIGYYSIKDRTYLRKQFIGEYELLSLLGNITLKGGKAFSHTHITFSGENYSVFGGHLFDAKISAAGEFIMSVGENNLHRKMNQEIGLPFWCLGDSIE